MASDAKVGIGRIKWLDAAKKSGMIARDGDQPDVYFDFGDVEVGIPQTDKTVQFVAEESPLGLGAVAKKVVVVSDAARSSQRKS